MILLLCRRWKILLRQRSQLINRRRILALDFGSRNIGLAVSDELGVTAQGLPTLRRSNKRNDLDHLRRVIKQYHIAEMVMGLPLRMSGSEGIQSEKVQVFAEELRRKFKLPVHLFDERLTSVEANRLLARNRHEHSPPRRSGGPAGGGADPAIVPGIPEKQKLIAAQPGG